jgi:sec-independent protein translocase protein TatC
MTLGEHFREFRRRLFICAASVFVASIVAGYFYDEVFAFLRRPSRYAESNPGVTASLNFAEATAALSNLISLSIFVGVIAASPIILWQAWAFIVPGLTGKEKRISLAFLGATIPLFLLGCWLGLHDPAAVARRSSTASARTGRRTSSRCRCTSRSSPASSSCSASASSSRWCSSASTSSGCCLRSACSRAGAVAVVLIFVFAAVATPTADPYTMFVFAAPLTFLYFAAWFVARLLDKRKEKARPDWLDVDDNQASPL